MRHRAIFRKFILPPLLTKLLKCVKIFINYIYGCYKLHNMFQSSLKRDNIYDLCLMDN